MLKNYNLEYYPPEKVIEPPAHVNWEIGQIIKLIGKNKNKKIVDFGSGGGRLTIPLLKNGYKIIAVDIDKTSQKQLLKAARLIKKEKYLKLKSKLNENIKYDFILGTDILHHINIDKYFKIFRNRLKKQGKIIFSEPNIFNLSWFVFITLFLDWRQEKRIIFCSSVNLKKKLKKYKFKNIKMIHLGLLPTVFFNKFPFLAKINYWLGNLPIINLFAYRIIFQAEK